MTDAREMTVSELGRSGGPAASAELARRAQLLEDLEPYLVPLVRAGRRTKDRETRAALEQVQAAILAQSPVRAQLVRAAAEGQHV